MTRNCIETAWYEFVRNFTTVENLTVIFADELSPNTGQGPRPPRPYVTLKIISGPEPVYQFDDFRFNSATNKFEICGLRQYSISIQSFGVDAIEALSELQMKLDLPEAIQCFHESDADISIVNKGPVTNISSLLETGFEDRASMDVVFNTTKSVESDPGIIEKIDFEGTLENGNAHIETGTVDGSGS